MLIPATPEALITPAAHYLTLDDVETEEVEEKLADGRIAYYKKAKKGWAALRSADNLYSFGRITGLSKMKMAEVSGSSYHMILETENRHVNFLQCPSQVRLGNILVKRILFKGENYLNTVFKVIPGSFVPNFLAV